MCNVGKRIPRKKDSIFFATSDNSYNNCAIVRGVKLIIFKVDRKHNAAAFKIVHFIYGVHSK